MFSMLVEAVVISFCVGGAVGSVITLHLARKGINKRSNK